MQLVVVNLGGLASGGATAPHSVVVCLNKQTWICFDRESCIHRKGERAGERARHGGGLI